MQRHGIRNVELLERVVRFVLDNIGNRLNAKNITDYFKSQQRKVDIVRHRHIADFLAKKDW